MAGRGVRPPGAPFPEANPQDGYYKIPLLKEPSWTWEIPLYFFVGDKSSGAVNGNLTDTWGTWSDVVTVKPTTSSGQATTTTSAGTGGVAF